MDLIIIRDLVGDRTVMVLGHRVGGRDKELAHGTPRAVAGTTDLCVFHFPTSKDMLGRKCGPEKRKQSHAAPMQPPPTPERPKKSVKEPAGEAKGYEEIRARIGKGKK